MEKERYEELSRVILDSCITVHKIMGPGLLESVYQLCLIKELELRGVNVESNVPVKLVYKGYDLDKEYIMDVLVEGELTIELKAVETMNPIYEAQLISYLKLAEKKMGFLVNFNVPLLKQGFRRYVNGY
jgi:GxxExxY protein